MNIQRIDVPRCTACTRHGLDHRCYCRGTGRLLECHQCGCDVTTDLPRKRKDGTGKHCYRLADDWTSISVCSEECAVAAMSEMDSTVESGEVAA